MTGVDVEHTKAQLADMRRQMEYARFMRVSTGRETAWKLLAKAESLVAAVERVQALHSPWPPPSLQTYCRTCAHPMPCPTRQALETLK